MNFKGLTDRIGNIGFKGNRGKARDTLGRVYEFFHGKFARAKSKVGGEAYLGQKNKRQRPKNLQGRAKAT